MRAEEAAGGGSNYLEAKFLKFWLPFIYIYFSRPTKMNE